MIISCDNTPTFPNPRWRECTHSRRCRKPKAQTLTRRGSDSSVRSVFSFSSVVGGAFGDSSRDDSRRSFRFSGRGPRGPEPSDIGSCPAGNGIIVGRESGVMARRATIRLGVRVRVWLTSAPKCKILGSPCSGTHRRPPVRRANFTFCGSYAQVSQRY